MEGRAPQFPGYEPGKKARPASAAAASASRSSWSTAKSSNESLSAKLSQSVLRAGSIEAHLLKLPAILMQAARKILHRRGGADHRHLPSDLQSRLPLSDRNQVLRVVDILRGLPRLGRIIVDEIPQFGLNLAQEEDALGRAQLVEGTDRKDYGVKGSG